MDGRQFPHMSEGRHDVILMDIEMPDMDGLEATRLIRTSATPEEPPQPFIVALTANAMAGDPASDIWMRGWMTI